MINNSKSSAPPIAIIGGGSWGSALAMVIARNGYPVKLWVRDTSCITQVNGKRINTKYLPDLPLPDLITISSNLASTLDDVKLILLAVPSHIFRETLKKIKAYIPEDAMISWATKGLDPQSGDLLHRVVAQELGDHYPCAILSGPSFAKEVACQFPTALTLAANHENTIQQLKQRLRSKTFRVYSSNDLVGVQLGGAIKNVLAIAAGISDGMGFGANARAALITRGLAEMQRLCEVMGGMRTTLMGLAGIGDLVLTCSDNQSRNRRCGLALGEGLTMQQAQDLIKQTIEGVTTAQQVYQLAHRFAVDMPICEQVYQIIYHNIAPTKAVEDLLARDYDAED